MALRLANPTDREHVRGTLPDGLVSCLIFSVLRTGGYRRAAKLYFVYKHVGT